MYSQNKTPATPLAMFASLWRNRQLIFELTRREVVSRYRGSLIGLAWSFFTPMILLAVYTFVFSTVFKARWEGSSGETNADFAIILFAGMIVFGLFSDVFNRAPGLIVSNINYVKKVVFPLEILPWVTMGSALFYSVTSLIVLLAVQLLVKGNIPWTVIYFPLVLLPLIFASMGVAWFLASLGVYIRDIGQMTSVLTTILMFVSAVFYPISSLPMDYQYWLRLNPLAMIITEGRKVLVFGEVPDWVALTTELFLGFFIAMAGFWWFQKTRKGFADVL